MRLREERSCLSSRPPVKCLLQGQSEAERSGLPLPTPAEGEFPLASDSSLPNLLVAVPPSAPRGSGCLGFPKTMVGRIFVFLFHWGWHRPAQPETAPGVRHWDLVHGIFPAFKTHDLSLEDSVTSSPHGPGNQSSRVPTCNKQAIHSTRKQLSNRPKMTPGRFLTNMPLDSFPSAALPASSINNAF